MLSKAAIRRQLRDALAQIAIVGSEVFYPAAWRFPDGDTGSAQTSLWLRPHVTTPRQQCLRIAVDHIEHPGESSTGGISDDETLDAAVERLYAVAIATEAARITGAQGGRKAASRMTPEARAERAKNAATARWISKR